MANTAVAYVKAWSGVMFSILLASIILYKAVIDRQRRLDESQTLPYQETDKQAEDWMSQYHKHPVAEEQVTGPTAPLQEVPKARVRYLQGIPLFLDADLLGRRRTFLRCSSKLFQGDIQVS